MTKKRSNKIQTTPARNRVSKKIGGKQLREIEGLLLNQGTDIGAIVETAARARLRKKLGKKELDKIESGILSGQFGKKGVGMTVQQNRR